LIDPKVIEDLAALTTQSGAPMLPSLLTKTEDAQARDFSALELAVAELDQPAIARIVHNIAGQAALLGAHDVTRRARELEDEAAAGELSSEEAEVALRELKRAWTRAVRALAQLVSASS
jgi:HPt (histidine-containing phosphotransfer) domain-containing protein